MTKEELLARLNEQILTRASLEGTMQGAIAPEIAACGEDRATYRFPAAPWMRNPYGILHGGLAAAMLDTSMGVLACALSGSAPVTVSLSLNYVQPVLLDRPIFVTARCVRCGRTLAYLTAELWQTEGEALVTANGSFYVAGVSSAGSASSAETAEIS